jgi:calcium channel MID1
VVANNARETMLPYPLLCLTQAFFLPIIYAQQQISLNSAALFLSSSVISIPASSSSLAISVALCSSPSNPPRFLFTNNTKVGTPTTADLGNPDVFEIAETDGIGNWMGFAIGGGILAATVVGPVTYEIGVSTSDPIHQYLNQQYPLLGDSTSNQALLFSPAFAQIPIETPSFPNYSLPSPQSPFSSSLPPSIPRFNLTLVPTSSSVLPSLPRSACALAGIKSTGTVVNQSYWLKDQTGWRSQWFIEGLMPQTNYTAYIIQDGTKVSGPTYFMTKSGMELESVNVVCFANSSLAAFSCPLVNSLPYCPSVSWAVPLPQPQQGIYDATNLPQTISDPLQQYIANFTAMLLTFACGRDIYSPLQTCADCHREYRSWLCAISFPRCGEPSSSSMQAALVQQDTSSSPRNPNFPGTQNAYMELLPCLETCYATARACPAFMKFQCPTNEFNAQASYGVGYIDSADGHEGGGLTGAAQDRYGNVWCNGG